MKKSKLVCIGNIGKPRGLKGEFFLNSFCNPRENILKYIDNIQTKDIKLSFEYIKKSNTKFHAKIKNVNDLDEIKEYTNIKLYISSNDLPLISSNETYWHDLVGMLVVNINKNEILGIIEGLNNFGSNDCLIVKPSTKSIDNKERLIPFIKQTFITSIDKENRLVKVDWESDY